MKLVDIGWAAGFLEGEGSFYFRGYSPCVVAGQVQKEPLERLESLLGGNVHFYKNNQPRHQDYHGWGVYGERAIGVMLTLYSLMSPRRQEQIRKSVDRWKNAPGWNQYKFATHCIRGHEFTEENTYIAPTGGRKCKACSRERHRKNYAKKKGSPARSYVFKSV